MIRGEDIVINSPMGARMAGFDTKPEFAKDDLEAVVSCSNRFDGRRQFQFFCRQPDIKKNDISSS